MYPSWADSSVVPIFMLIAAATALSSASQFQPYWCNNILNAPYFLTATKYIIFCPSLEFYIPHCFYHRGCRLPVVFVDAMLPMPFDPRSILRPKYNNSIPVVFSDFAVLPSCLHGINGFGRVVTAM